MRGCGCAVSGRVWNAPYAGSCRLWYEVDLHIDSRIWSILYHQGGDC